MDNSNEIINRLARLQNLCTELLETLTITLLFIKEYTEEHSIPIPNRQKLAYFLQKAILLLEECGLPTPSLQEPRKSRKLPSFFFDDEKTDKLPES